MKARKLVYGVCILVLSILSQSCATIFGGRNNSFVFENENYTQAEVFINDSLVGNASGKLVLPKRVIQHGSILEVRADGYESQEYLILRKVHPLYTVGNILIGGIPLLVDFADGNILRPSPRKFEVELTKEEN